MSLNIGKPRIQEGRKVQKPIYFFDHKKTPTFLPTFFFEQTGFRSY
jgi:hypothetical protein